MTSVSTTQDFYELLGVQRKATKEQIREAYREIARIYHPDSHFYADLLPQEMASPDPVAEEKFKAITEAYNVLSSDAQRQAYDQTLLGELPGWEEESRANWRAEQARDRIERASAKGQDGEIFSGTQSHAWGAFGKVQPAAGSAFDDPELAKVKSVSEILRMRRGLLGKIRWLLGLN